MSRVQLALNVSNMDAAVEFYRTLFGVEPHKRRPGYANFVVTDPPLKLALFEVANRGVGVAGALNHVGIEVGGPHQVRSEDDRLSGLSQDLRRNEATVCCHAEQDKVWLDDPDGLEWEIYAVTDDAPDGQELLMTENCCS